MYEHVNEESSFPVVNFENDDKNYRTINVVRRNRRSIVVRTFGKSFFGKTQDDNIQTEIVNLNS
jgi:hypothetical protein